MSTRDYSLCFLALPLGSIPAAILLVWVGDAADDLLLVTSGLSVASGVWAWWRQSARAGLAIAIGTFALTWVALLVALFVAVIALGGAG